MLGHPRAAGASSRRTSTLCLVPLLEGFREQGMSGHVRTVRAGFGGLQRSSCAFLGLQELVQEDKAHGSA